MENKRKSLIVTVAGKATRFNRDTERDTLKCIYSVGTPADTLLYQILCKCDDFDELIVVGGYLQEELDAFIAQLPEAMSSRIVSVHNPHYFDYGSAYSLWLGIEALAPGFQEVIFVEGDLYFDDAGFRKVIAADSSVFTVNHELIDAAKAVICYRNMSEELKYLYDTAHKELEIKEPFLGVYNSAQIWKFADPKLLKDVADSLTDENKRGTNLEIIQRYFLALPPGGYEMVDFPVWYNCNTVADYNKVYSEIHR